MTAFLILFGIVPTFAQTLKLNQLTDQEKKAGWKLLFDGSSFKGWKSLDTEQPPQKGWQVKNGVLTVLGHQGGGDIITDQAYTNFELTLEVKLTEGANSGLKYFIQPPCSVGFEYQILDNDKHPDAKFGINGNRKFASLYDLLPAIGAQPKAIGQWNQVHLIVNGNHIEHWLNAKKVLAFDRSSKPFWDAYKTSKFLEFKDFGTYQQGHILLQEHGNTVSYRNIKLRVLQLKSKGTM
jgi:hypothetical protein